MDEYQRFALLYDPLIGAALRPIYRELADRLKRHGCTSMADLCCGTGMLAGLAARDGMTALGIDLSPAMLGVAVRKHSARFIMADAAVLPLDDDSLDGAALSFSLHEKPWDTARAILAEARRIVRPGGVVMVADYRTRPGNGWWTGHMIATVERLAGSAHHGHFREYMDRGGTDGFLRAAGLAGRCEQTFFSGWAGVYSVPVPE